MRWILLQIIIFCAFLAVITSDKTKCREGARYWSTMAEAHLEDGSFEGAFKCYQECIAEGSASPIILFQFGELLLSSQQAAADFYAEDTRQIVNRAFLLFKSALEADPANWELAADIARNHNLVQKSRPEEAIAAWEQALRLSRTEDQREEAWLNLARAQFMSGFNTEALESLAALHSPEYDTFKRRLTSRVEQQTRCLSDEYRRKL